MKCEINGVIIREFHRHHDQRGWLAELFRHDELPREYHPTMSYISLTRPGVTRGPHEHREQADLFCFLGSSTFRLYLWDNRSDSPTFDQSWFIDVGEERYVLVIVPPGVVHAYRNIGAVDGLVFNAPNRLYAGEGRQSPVDEIRYEDDHDCRFRIDD
jgi:dTDP-4-dehydrorhamnose 3,5-epimerase